MWGGELQEGAGRQAKGVEDLQEGGEAEGELLESDSKLLAHEFMCRATRG